MDAVALHVPESLKHSTRFWTLRSNAVRVHNALREQLLARDASVLSLWEGRKGAELAHRLREVARDQVNWPNAFFVPEDPWELLSWDDFDQLTFVELRIEAEVLIGRRLGRGYWEDLGEEATFGEVVAALTDARELELGKPRVPGRLVTAIRRACAAVSRHVRRP